VSANSHHREILDNLVARASFGFIIYNWEPGERFPRCEWVNDAALARMRIAREAILADTSGFYSIDANARALAVMREHLERCDATAFDVEVTSAEGSSYWIECSVNTIERTPDGGYRYIVVTHAIDRRKEQEHFSDLLAATIDSEQDGVFIVRVRDEDPLKPPVIYANAAFSRITGYTQDDLANGIYPRILGERSDVESIGESSRAVQSGRAVVTEVELYRKDGSRFWAEVRAHPLEDPVVHCALSIHDITARRRNEEAMQLLYEAISQASDLMIVTDTTPISDGGPRILYVNRAFLEATGYEERELLGEPYLFIYSENNAPLLMKSIRGSIEAGEPSYREVLVRRKDGGDFWVESVERPFVTRHERQLRLLVGRDITIRRRSTTQLSLLYSAAELASTPIIIYEPACKNGLTVLYENEAAASREHYHLADIWQRDDDEARVVRERLTAGDLVDITYARNDERVHLTARAIRTESRIEAVLTQERVRR
jgi:PAS domain S-box-containing protein